MTLQIESALCESTLGEPAVRASIRVESEPGLERQASASLAALAGPVVVRGRASVALEPKYGVGRTVADVDYLWTGAAGAPTIIVQGGISAGRDVCGVGAGTSGWWDALVGPGCAIDLQRYRVLSIDWLGADAVGAASISSEDQADALAGLLDVLKITRAHAFVGASYGAMTALAFAVRHPDRVARLVALAGAHRPHPLATAQRSVQRGIIRLGLASGHADEALSLARQLAMTTYRGSEEFANRFSGEPQEVDGRLRLPVEEWLESAGRRFVGRFDADRYLALSESIDLHSVDPAAVRVPTALIGFASDRLVPLADVCDLQRRLGAPASLDVVESPYGHDGFLKEHLRLAPLLRTALQSGL